MLMNRIVALVLVVTMSATAVGFTGLSLYFLLLPTVGAAASAALTAVAFAFIPALVLWIQHRKTTQSVQPSSIQARAAPMPEALVSSLAVIARSYPLIAMTCAAAMGVADSLASSKK